MGVSRSLCIERVSRISANQPPRHRPCCQPANSTHRSCSALASWDTDRPTSTNFSTQLILSCMPAQHRHVSRSVAQVTRG
jgi:hypothetical protein